ncbi:MAG TPA: M1 family metallopeptidase [Rhizomicrobium sp.]|jgi:alanyl aminopeptidase|nr:M1 family metallopeptidase [Rhizomicrobium sp.]
MSHTAPVIAALALALVLASCGKTPEAAKTAAQPTPAAQPVPDPGPVPLGPLPRVATPTHYRLAFTIDPTKTGFSGLDDIDVTFSAPVRTLYIHGLGLRVTSVVLHPAKGAPIAAQYKEVDKSGVALLTFAREVPAGAARLSFVYDAGYDQSLAGLYKVVARGDAYAFTQFESIDARRAFPGFDEPGFKATFDVSVTAPVADKVIANTPVVSDTGAGNGMMRWTFQTTKPLPTYLIALAVGPLDIVDMGDIPANQYRDHPLHLRGIAARGMGPKLQYALSLTPSVIQALEAYYGIGYPFQKVDILAVPDFAAGAMENAGAVTFREQLLLMDANAPLDQKRASLSVQAHELAHQWFGDFVTPAWWDNIWLNESFATWMAGKISNTVRPDEEFARESLHNGLDVMRLDELPSARQIHNPVNGPDDIENAFDDITYSKGSAVLAMFESYVGPEAWQKGIHAYLTKFGYKNATAEDFITTIATETGHPEIVDAFNNFIDQPGIPLLKSDLSCSAAGAVANVTQSPYASVGIAPSDHSWKVPMCLTADGAKSCQLVTPPSTQVLIGSVCPKMVFPNAEGAGYYRFSLDEKGWADLIKAAPTLDPADQLTLAHGVDAALRGGHAQAADYFTLIHTLAPIGQWDLFEDDRNSFTITGSLHDMRVTGVIGAGDLPAYQAFIRRNFGPRLKQIGLVAKPNEPVATGLLRHNLVQLLVEEGRDPTVIAPLSKAAQTYLASGGNDLGGIPPELLEEAMRAGVYADGAPFVDQVLTALQKSDDEYFIQSAIYAAAGAEDTASIDKLLALTLTPAIRIGDLRYVLRDLWRESKGQAESWIWFKANLKGVEARVSAEGLGSAPNVFAIGCDANAKAELDGFFGPKTGELQGTPRSLRQNDERIDRCMAFKQAKGAEISAALKTAK